ncbi:hypothetical protein BDV98DRAFT_589133 [Pterulicium gracile]|uniref:Uncharacterized protein n=1 Tax=Pterulicium gracile TaxID=1884261 RepID=A0A5C3QUA5_9AGAR|nr:hypothetical protein BDV98DRAFT_589133 [Pterula gracilis]
MVDNNQHSSNQKPCCVCGLTDTRSLYVQDSPFKNGIFDYSQQSIAKARHVVDEGASKVNALDRIIRRLQEHRNQMQRVVFEHQAFLPRVRPGRGLGMGPGSRQLVEGGFCLQKMEVVGIFPA